MQFNPGGKHSKKPQYLQHLKIYKNIKPSEPKAEEQSEHLGISLLGKPLSPKLIQEHR